MPKVTVSVQRSASEPGGKSRFERYEVEAGEKASILDTLL